MDTTEAHRRSGSGSVTSAQGKDAKDVIRDQIADVFMRQLEFRRHMQAILDVDSPGLATMIHLAQEGSDTPSSIARTLESSTAATSLVLNRLEASGHITRRQHPTDGRKVIVVPAPESIAAAYECASPVMAGTNELVARMSKAERTVVARFLDGLIEVYDESLRKRT